MFLLMQFSAFDFRVLQSPDVLVSPVRSWPQVQPNQEFLNNFGLIKESYKSVLSPYLLPEDNIYIDCKKSLKFPERKTKDDLMDIHVKMRRMVFDGRGGVKLLIGMVLHLGKGFPFADLEDTLTYALNKKIRISAPGQDPKEVSLGNLSAPFKNLYAHSSSLKSGEAAHMHLVKSQSPLLLLDMSQREFDHFQPEGTYDSFSFDGGLKLLYGRNEYGGKPLRTFLTLNINGSELNRLTKYHVSQLNAYIENMSSMLLHHKRGEVFSERAKEAFSQAHAIIQGTALPLHWEPIYRMFQKLFEKQLSQLKQEKVGDILSENKRANEASLQQLIAHVVQGELDQTFSLAKELKDMFEPEEEQGLLMLETRFNRAEREEREGVVNPEELRIERNQISSSLLKLFKSV